MSVPTLQICGAAVPLKYVALAVLVIQTSTIVLVLRASRRAEELYISSTAILLAELVKLVTCLCIVFFGAPRYSLICVPVLMC